MRTFLLILLVTLIGCAPPDAPFWCTSFCDALGRQTARCTGANGPQTATRCAQQLNCPSFRSVRSLADLQTCIRQIDGGCFSELPLECQMQFGR